MSRIVVLGCGMVGSAIAADLAERHDVTVVDRDADALARAAAQCGVDTVVEDLADSGAITRSVDSADLVVCAVPGFMGFATLETIIEAGRSVVDISFFNRDPFDLDNAARDRGVTAIVDCGVAPGMSNAILGYHDAAMDVQEFEFMVGGLPVARHWPYEYKAPFSPIDVLEEYTRAARFKVNGEIVTRPALSDPELVDFAELGTLEAFNTDGLRTLLTTTRVPTMREKTLRYPGHIEKIRVLRDSGFLDPRPIDVGGHAVAPLDLSAKLLFEHWRLAPDEPEFTVMRVIVRGLERGEPVEYQYDLLDRFDEATQTSSMARTTGYTCSAACELVLRGIYRKPGISPPEYVGASPGALDAILEYLADRRVNYRRRRGTWHRAG